LEPFRGVFTIPVTPFDEQGQLSEADLRRVIRFCLDAGAHGIVTPVNASEFSALSDDERRTVAEIAVEETGGRIPVVIGVSGVSAEVAVGFARHAKAIGADAVIAMPPYVRKPHMDGVFAYYRSLSEATDLPIFVQNYPLPVGVPMSPEFMARMVREIPHVRYIKEELQPTTHMVSASLRLAGDLLRGVFGGAAGRHMMDEMRRGACGVMPACDVTDLHVSIWEAYRAGDAALARQRFNRLLPLLNMEFLYGVHVYKEVLKRRGIIRTTYVRSAAIQGLDRDDHLELDEILADLHPLFTTAVPPVRG
jgi:4-hydroxy-tetrahydrodipicolinate synthase